jgi:hypothetical protein
MHADTHDVMVPWPAVQCWACWNGPAAHSRLPGRHGALCQKLHSSGSKAAAELSKNVSMHCPPSQCCSAHFLDILCFNIQESWDQGTSKVLHLSTGFPYNVLSLCTRPEVACMGLCPLGKNASVITYCPGKMSQASWQDVTG